MCVMYVYHIWFQKLGCLLYNMFNMNSLMYELTRNNTKTKNLDGHTIRAMTNQADGRPSAYVASSVGICHPSFCGVSSIIGPQLAAFQPVEPVEIVLGLLLIFLFE